MTVANSFRAIVVAGWVLASSYVAADQLVFGSFRSADNAANWAKRLSGRFGTEIVVTRVEREAVIWHRVVSADLSPQAFAALSRQASLAGVRHWRLLAPAPPQTLSERDSELVEVEPRVSRSTEPLPRLTPPSPPTETTVPLPEVVESRAVPEPRSAGQITEDWSWDLSGRSRFFRDAGLIDDTRAFASLAGELEYYKGWHDDRDSITFKPFLRVAAEGGRRTHFDVRELYYSRVGESWDAQAGVRRVFWGVTEFHHLIDIVNQTDLVENFDTEDKLGQPMLSLSLIRDWGLLDIYALIGFRERNFNGRTERLGLPWHMRDAEYESGAEESRVDLAVRWSHSLGPFELGVHHFSGTSREPLLVPAGMQLLPYYPVIDQTGLDAQALYGNWAFKLEGFTRSGFGARYAAANIGLERTFVGVFDSAVDVGLVLEYMYDERGDEAFNTLFEDDVAIGGRLALNDVADTQALLGVILDTARDETVISLEASTRLSDNWSVSLESRIFQGGERILPLASPLVLLDGDYKSAWLQDEDYLQLELTRYF